DGGVFTWTPTEAQGPGVFTATVRVSDGNLSDSETFSITVNEINTAPVLAPLADQTIMLGATVSFTATAADTDLPANPLTFTLGPGSVGSITVSGDFTWTPTAAGVYTAAIRVSDGELSDAAIITITVTEEPVYTLRIATAGDGQGTVTPGLGVHEYLSGATALVTATAQADSDFAGWTGACSGAAPTCTVWMDSDKVVTATFALKAGNHAPVANAGADQTVGPGASVTLDGSASSDPDGNWPLTYFWQQTGGPAVSFTPTVSRTTFSAPETATVLTFTLVVTDNLGLAAPTPDTVVITVEPHALYLPLVLRNP
ncbi:MAG TPA: PKD domain-containing protein, partial [Anaerolineae bacterium]|nr:PKD domain-containing protein [Anaerolineae bacterium]